ncbi:MAG: hypothetical protein FD164_1019 [Nitrospirae bacterium]|nr:MAG: hypothetical protein FD164_1019 [Nitrospirota bacterium]
MISIDASPSASAKRAWSSPLVMILVFLDLPDLENWTVKLKKYRAGYHAVSVLQYDHLQLDDAFNNSLLPHRSAFGCLIPNADNQVRIILYVASLTEVVEPDIVFVVLASAELCAQDYGDNQSFGKFQQARRIQDVLVFSASMIFTTDRQSTDPRTLFFCSALKKLIKKKISIKMKELLRLYFITY